MNGHESIETFADIYDLVIQLSEEYGVDIKKQAKYRTKTLGSYSECKISDRDIPREGE